MRRFFQDLMNSSNGRIALLHWSPWLLRWADGSKLKSSHIILTPGWGGFCVSVLPITSVWQSHTHTPAWLRIPSKPPKPMLFCLLFCLCIAIFLSLFTLNSKFSLKCKGFLTLSLIPLQSANFPPLHLRIILTFKALQVCFSLFLTYSLSLPRVLLGSSYLSAGEIQISLPQWANYSPWLFLWTLCFTSWH